MQPGSYTHIQVRRRADSAHIRRFTVMSTEEYTVSGQSPYTCKADFA